MVKPILFICSLLLPVFSFAQSVGPVKVLATEISPGEGSKVHIAQYKVIEVLEGELTNDTVYAGYYFYKAYENPPDTAVLTLVKYTDSSGIQDYYIFPDYDAKTYILPARIEKISFAEWEPCETGEGECKPFTFTRNSSGEKWFLMVPCGGTETSVSLSGKGLGDKIMNIHIFHEDCPPVFELTELPDGQYAASMASCGLGGTVEINLVTNR